MTAIGSTTPTYDLAGNLTSDGTYSPSYDAESHMISDAGVTYTYDSAGRRVTKSSGTSYLYGLDGQVITELNSGGSITTENASRGATPRATWTTTFRITWVAPEW